MLAACCPAAPLPNPNKPPITAVVPKPVCNAVGSGVTVCCILPGNCPNLLRP